jgi:hypothetical protein
MKIEKMTLKGIKNVLSRSEMKKIMAGSSGGGGRCDTAQCPDFNCCSGLVCCSDSGNPVCVPAGACSV